MKLYTSQAWLRKRLLLDHKRYDEVARECGVDEMTIRRWAKKFGLG